MTPEQIIIASAVHSWKQNVERASKAFSGLSDHQLQTEVAPGRNRLVYLWGQLTAVHDAMLPLLGLGDRLHPELDAAFLTAVDKAVDGLPSAAELQRHWGEVNGHLLAGFDNFTASDWAGKHTAVSDEDFAANPLRNRLSVLLGRTGHLAYHIGPDRTRAEVARSYVLAVCGRSAHRLAVFIDDSRFGVDVVAPQYGGVRRQATVPRWTYESSSR